MHSSRMRTSRSLTVCRGGEVLPHWGCASFPGASLLPPCTEADPPPCEQNDRQVQNITLATTSLRPVMKQVGLRRVHDMPSPCHPYCPHVVPVIPISQDFLRFHRISPETFSVYRAKLFTATVLKMRVSWFNRDFLKYRMLATLHNF